MSKSFGKNYVQILNGSNLLCSKFFKHGHMICVRIQFRRQMAHSRYQPPMALGELPWLSPSYPWSNQSTGLEAELHEQGSTCTFCLLFIPSPVNNAWPSKGVPKFKKGKSIPDPCSLQIWQQVSHSSSISAGKEQGSLV